MFVWFSKFHDRLWENVARLEYRHKKNVQSSNYCENIIRKKTQFVAKWEAKKKDHCHKGSHWKRGSKCDFTNMPIPEKRDLKTAAEKYQLSCDPRSLNTVTLRNRKKLCESLKRENVSITRVTLFSHWVCKLENNPSLVKNVSFLQSTWLKSVLFVT